MRDTLTALLLIVAGLALTWGMIFWQDVQMLAR